MLSCKEVSGLLSAALDRRLSFRERFAMRLHLLLCKMCSRYQQHLRFLQCAIRHYRDKLRSHDSVDVPVLSIEARERLHEVIQQEK